MKNEDFGEKGENCIKKGTMGLIIESLWVLNSIFLKIACMCTFKTERRHLHFLTLGVGAAHQFSRRQDLQHLNW